MKTLNLLSALFLTISSSLLTCTVSAKGQGFFDQDCGTSSSSGPAVMLDWAWLQTYCNDHVCNVNSQTRINLNRCIGNVNGSLTPQKDGYFGKTCMNCFLEDEGHTLNCICPNIGQTEWVISKMDLNMGVLYNWFGWLTCFGVYETEVSHSYDICKPKDWKPDPAQWDYQSCDNDCWVWSHQKGDKDTIEEDPLDLGIAGSNLMA